MSICWTIATASISAGSWLKRRCDSSGSNCEMRHSLCGCQPLRVRTQWEWETLQFVSYFTRYSRVINTSIGRGRKVWRRQYVTAVVNQNGRSDALTIAWYRPGFRQISLRHNRLKQEFNSFSGETCVARGLLYALDYTHIVAVTKPDKFFQYTHNTCVSMLYMNMLLNYGFPFESNTVTCGVIASNP